MAARSKLRQWAPKLVAVLQFFNAVASYALTGNLQEAFTYASLGMVFLLPELRDARSFAIGAWSACAVAMLHIGIGAGFLNQFSFALCAALCVLLLFRPLVPAETARTPTPQ